MKTDTEIREPRCFNTIGICEPEKHYMVSLGQRLAQVKTLIDEGKYFTVNRARQFGKTTDIMKAAYTIPTAISLKSQTRRCHYA
ncbi:MAG: hypothetical protein NC548_44240 [Lachnospiraceae bacterium]|nr:hypothetical protein [Lachnospiraceae bacterium]